MISGTWRTFTQRLCHIKRTGFPGFGFILLKDTENGRHTIIQIEKDSPAESCGLTKGDTIIEVNGVNVEDSTHEEVIQRTMETGDEITLLVMREKDRDKNFDAASSSGTDGRYFARNPIVQCKENIKKLINFL